MNPIVKKLIISIVISIIAFFILVAIGPAGFHIPSSNQDFVTITIIFFSVLTGSILSGTFKSSHDPYFASSASGDVETGTVKWFNVKKGYGFITRDRGDDVFVHYRNIHGNGRRAVGEGQRVQLIVVDGDKGLQADEVEAI